ncbi:hypothetical protein RIF29_24964 [Crotalaria pallida]|uniref:Ribonuclease H1 N-terminal domain-containing protein n=1 Tax=Crotalaria pallida TaxID=3830 RepID=A0AAN9HX25_CROPI
MGKYYVVFEGRTPGVYSSWAQCKAQVNEFSGCSYCSFPTKLEIDREYARFISKMKNSGGAELRKVSFEDNDDPGSSMDPNPVVFAPRRDVDNELLGITMQNWLARISWNLLRADPIYTKHSVIDVGRIEYTSYNVNYSFVVIGEDQCTIGRFAKGEFLAREDAALFMLRRLLAWSNREIVDFNHFNLKDLEVQNAVLEAQNVELIVENEKLKNELKMLRRKFNLN